MALEAAHVTVRVIILAQVPDDTKCWQGKCKLQGGLASHPISPIGALAPASQPAQSYNDIGVYGDHHIEKEKCKLFKQVDLLRIGRKKLQL